MRPRAAFQIASLTALAATAAIVLAAVVVATFGLIGLTGSGEYRYRLEADLPGMSLRLGFHPSWEVQQYGEVCALLDVRDPAQGCHNLVLAHGEAQESGSVIQQGDVRPVAALLSGPLYLDPEPGWSPLIASLYFMQVLALLVLAFLLAQLWLLLRSAARGRAFSGPMVRRMRLMGWTMVGWELLEPALWLFLSPKAHDYHAMTFGPFSPHLQLGSMEPGGPSFTVIAFGLLLVLLAEVFRHGADLAEEQSLTV